MIIRDVYNVACESRFYKETKEKHAAWTAITDYLKQRGIEESDYDDLLNDFDAESEYCGFMLGFKSGIEVMSGKD